ncbi:Na+/H+ antiporter NhaC [Tissierella praeacuta]|uniref:Transporter, NhaC family (TC 2.A.35) n=2 Tax=Tissierella TaxID=41273 RepID=A0A1M4XMP9_9FIRM|nr:Na+/H+ antiporter NhaC [Tissierella praeacuta]TCU75501.1 transporter (NhaC family) [Tissierella praeacuta]SHE94698.1 transporter, NhaC family (TC 2.A.35) [Tissierella praeacuta DSM 18095]SUO99844.1 Malate-2H(+)/Na(+)-lactate antiporter [Tissierella praeacuta]
MSKKERVKKKPTFIQGFFPILFMVISLTLGVGVLKIRTEPIIIISAFVAGIIAWRLGYSWEEMQAGVIEKIARALPATLILWSVGLLIGSWMFSGTVPMIIYYGVRIVNPKYLLVTAFIISAILSTITGTSWGSAGTIGVAIMGIAGGLGAPLAPVAGAVVAGAYFGDKLSPFSDTTNLAPLAAGSELYEHIKHMLYTTIPATIVSLIVYFIVGMGTSGEVGTPETVDLLQGQLDSMFNWNILLLLPVVFIIAGSLLKLPTIPTMLGTSIFSVIIGMIVQGFTLKNGFISLIQGFNVSMTGYEGEISTMVTTLINRGGVVSVTSTTVLVFCAMGFAGIISISGMLDVVLEELLKRVKTTAGIILSTIASCFTVAFVTGNSYLSILIPGELFRDVYVERNLHPKNLSRTLEDSGTVLVPLIPWSAAGAYMSTTLGVSTMEYLPWAILNYMGIVFAIILAFTGFGIAKLSPEDKKRIQEEV